MFSYMHDFNNIHTAKTKFESKDRAIIHSITAYNTSSSIQKSALLFVFGEGEKHPFFNSCERALGN